MTTIFSSPHITDIVPEFIHYDDTGCEVSQACLNCPLPQCKYDDPDWFRHHQRLIKDLEVLTAMRLENLSVEETSESMCYAESTDFCKCVAEVNGK